MFIYRFLVEDKVVLRLVTCWNCLVSSFSKKIVKIMSEESINKYENCIFKDKNCGNHKRRWIDGIFKIKELKIVTKIILKV